MRLLAALFSNGLVVFVCVIPLITCYGQELRFEAASVKVSGPDAPRTPQISGWPDDPGLFRAHIDMSSLLMGAFGVEVDRIKGPAWLRDFSAMPFYDIVATIPKNATRRAATREEVEKMLQNLLVERFHLEYRRRTEYFPGYDLIVSKGGSKLREVSAESSVDSSQSANQIIGSDGFPVLAGPRTLGWHATATHQRIKYQERTMSEIAKHLGILIALVQAETATDGFSQPRVADKTGLEGRYTFILQFECTVCAARTANLLPQSAGKCPEVR